MLGVTLIFSQLYRLNPTSRCARRNAFAMSRQLGLAWVWFGFSTTVITANVMAVVVVVMGVAVFATMIACMRACSVTGLPRLFATSVWIAVSVAAVAVELPTRAPSAALRLPCVTIVGAAGVPPVEVDTCKPGTVIVWVTPPAVTVMTPNNETVIVAPPRRDGKGRHAATNTHRCRRCGDG